MCLTQAASTSATPSSKRKLSSAPASFKRCSLGKGENEILLAEPVLTHTHSTPSLWIVAIRDSVCGSGLSVFSNLLEIDQTAIGITCSKGPVGSPWMSTTHTTLLIRPLFWSLALKLKEQVAQPVCKQVCRCVPRGWTWHSLACTMGLWGRRVVLELTISQ